MKKLSRLKSTRKPTFKKVASTRLLPTSKKKGSAKEIADLVKSLKQFDKEYHTRGTPSITDKQYDALKDRLRELDPTNSYLKDIGAPVGRAAKITLPVEMGSLDKLYVGMPEKIIAWLKKNKSSTYILTDKLDGISALLENKGGKLYLYTRGNGSEGTNISHLIPYLRFIPKLKVGQMVRGEIMLSKADFKKYLSQSFKNPRNTVAGMANKTKVVHAAAKYAQFIIHEMIKPAAPLPRVAKQLEAMGGKVVPFKVIRGIPTQKQIDSLLKARSSKNDFEVDGIVIDALNGNRIAIKQENEVATPTVKEVRWAPSQHGYMIPVAHFTAPVKIAGVEVTKATGHNAKMIVDNKIGPGAIVSITRAGEVIPKIVGVIKGTKAQLPPKGSYEWLPPAKGKTESTHIKTTDEEHISEIEVKQLVNFLEKLKIKSFKENKLALLYEAGIDTPIKLIRATSTRLQAAGLGPKDSTTLVTAIREGLNKATVPDLMVASNLFPRGFGLTAAKAAWKAIGNTMFTASLSQMKAKLTKVHGFGETAISSFTTGIGAFIRFVAVIKWSPKTPSNSIKSNSKLAGLTIVFTGFRDAALAEKLEASGAKITSSVSKNTDYLIVKDKSYSNDKTDKAKSIPSIKVITAEQARRMWL